MFVSKTGRHGTDLRLGKPAYAKYAKSKVIIILSERNFESAAIYYDTRPIVSQLQWSVTVVRHELTKHRLTLLKIIQEKTDSGWAQRQCDLI